MGMPVRSMENTALAPSGMATEPHMGPYHSVGDEAVRVTLPEEAYWPLSVWLGGMEIWHTGDRVAVAVTVGVAVVLEDAVLEGVRLAPGDSVDVMEAVMDGVAVRVALSLGSTV